MPNRLSFASPGGDMPALGPLSGQPGWEPMYPDPLGGPATPSYAPPPQAASRPPGLLGGGTDRTDALLAQMTGLLGNGSLPPPPDRMQHMLGGALRGVMPLMGPQAEKVSPWQVLAAAGAGLAGGQQGYRQAQQEYRGRQLQDIGAGLKVEDARTAVETTARERQAAFALARKLRDAGRPDEAAAVEQDPSLAKEYFKSLFKTGTDEGKVVPPGGSVYRNGKFETAPGGAYQSGPLEGTGIDAQMTNVYVTLQQKQASGQPLTQQETMLLQLSERHLMKPRVVPTANGGFAEVAPQPLPGLAPPPTAAPAPAPAPAPSRVTQLREGTPTPNNEQSLAAGFANRLNAANQIFDSLENEGYVTPGQYDRAVDAIPVVGNYLTSGQFQRQEQAQREFINAQLRRESGAAISPAEFENAARQYFPQPGDSPEVLAQKRRSRNMAIANMAQSAGPAKVGFTPPKVDMDDRKPGGGDLPPPPPGFKVR